MNNKAYHITNYRSQQLSRFVDSYKIYRFNDNIPVKLNPTGHFELILQLHGNFSHKTSSTSGWESRPNYFIGGLHNQSFYVKSKCKGSKLISIQLKPNGSKHFIPDKLNLYKNKIVSLNELFNKSELELLENISEDDLSINHLDEVELFLIKILKEKQVSPIDNACNIIIQQNGFTNINQLALTVCISNSQFRRRFNEEIGMSPKEYSKIVRVNFIFNFLSQNPKIKLTDLTYRLGYFDQSHFIKDFQSVTGLSPKKHLQQFSAL